METLLGRVPLFAERLLETFLVEWKLQLRAGDERLSFGLETFLVEWKLCYIPNSC